MQIIKQQNIDLGSIVDELKNGKVIVYPTETCYGLGCDATNPEAVAKVFQIKKRQHDKPVLVLVPTMSMMLYFVNWSPILAKIADFYWPGPLTAVVPLRPEVTLPSGVVGADKTIAFRVTDHFLASSLSDQLGVPLVSTSANIASYDSPYEIDRVFAMFERQEFRPDIIIDAGSLPHHSPSTVVRVGDNRVDVLRQGEIKVDVERFCK
ncbi:MAG: threonylcarbamoyl-AMP synthase [Candidatus Magasanikbacteria bacterium CG_4_10_14_0_2_um_filter_37_12]|uniref:L-threonylcarbamoyladenylate synthase n=1 Tax=Candidatus Magasanikbacteria bacterium CG_4_10_14_0_2_um_filter_37_12 TaxID=1974637 RepID=A0A2M7V9K9_9BACT|nr:MAG: threonylcarbamoyl-AMP synthase [Candidatus Magasanikbacteria bacterium CG_4_10_14_0_2_um_filter_37_12]